MVSDIPTRYVDLALLELHLQYPNIQLTLFTHSHSSHESHTMAFKYLLLTALYLQSCLANVEKTIFLGPATVNVPHQHPTLEDLRLDVLTPDTWTLRTKLAADFPNEKNPFGKTSWFLLDSLTPYQRYEVRVCWPATQPTSFTLETFSLPTVWDTPELVASLAEYAYSRQPASEDEIASSSLPATGESEASVLFLRIIAKADYFTTNATLMSDVPPVDVDIILDPFVLNVLPRSLVPTVGYIIVVAAASFFAAKYVLRFLQAIIRGDGVERKVKKQQ
ncbi:hypothetical protein CONLIGDRAFT_434831 [Coniochaeta ligniaria NRRL 30616]|uniref:Uncharacterized protein n=1 Tax=Coniochaeta ligniaria NRRL 30616 TaxID=1408157 RepID=A0A1J7JCR4_9PEZI|nr:hypothetical protein CONLIGDRAFT_434831 [Coniochaeta ligniaria NRRL 30616]